MRYGVYEYGCCDFRILKLFLGCSFSVEQKNKFGDFGELIGILIIRGEI